MAAALAAFPHLAASTERWHRELLAAVRADRLDLVPRVCEVAGVAGRSRAHLPGKPRPGEGGRRTQNADRFAPQSLPESVRSALLSTDNAFVLLPNALDPRLLRGVSRLLKKGNKGKNLCTSDILHALAAGDFSQIVDLETCDRAALSATWVAAQGRKKEGWLAFARRQIFPSWVGGAVNGGGSESERTSSSISLSASSTVKGGGAGVSASMAHDYLLAIQRRSEAHLADFLPFVVPYLLLLLYLRLVATSGRPELETPVREVLTNFLALEFRPVETRSRGGRGRIAIPHNIRWQIRGVPLHEFISAMLEFRVRLFNPWSLTGPHTVSFVKRQTSHGGQHAGEQINDAEDHEGRTQRGTLPLFPHELALVSEQVCFLNEAFECAEIDWRARVVSERMSDLSSEGDRADSDSTAAGMRDIHSAVLWLQEMSMERLEWLYTLRDTHSPADEKFPFPDRVVLAHLRALRSTKSDRITHRSTSKAQTRLWLAETLLRPGNARLLFDLLDTYARRLELADFAQPRSIESPRQFLPLSRPFDEPVLTEILDHVCYLLSALAQHVLDSDDVDDVVVRWLLPLMQKCARVVVSRLFHLDVAAAELLLENEEAILLAEGEKIAADSSAPDTSRQTALAELVRSVDVAADACTSQSLVGADGTPAPHVASTALLFLGAAYGFSDADGGGVARAILLLFERILVRPHVGEIPYSLLLHTHDHQMRRVLGATSFLFAELEGAQRTVTSVQLRGRTSAATANTLSHMVSSLVSLWREEHVGLDTPLEVRAHIHDPTPHIAVADHAFTVLQLFQMSFSRGLRLHRPWVKIDERWFIAISETFVRMAQSQLSSERKVDVLVLAMVVFGTAGFVRGVKNTLRRRGGKGRPRTPSTTALDPSFAWLDEPLADLLRDRIRPPSQVLRIAIKRLRVFVVEAAANWYAQNRADAIGERNDVFRIALGVAAASCAETHSLIAHTLARAHVNLDDEDERRAEKLAKHGRMERAQFPSADERMQTLNFVAPLLRQCSLDVLFNHALSLDFVFEQPPHAYGSPSGQINLRCGIHDALQLVAAHRRSEIFQKSGALTCSISRALAHPQRDQSLGGVLFEGKDPVVRSQLLDCMLVFAEKTFLQWRNYTLAVKAEGTAEAQHNMALLVEQLLPIFHTQFFACIGLCDALLVHCEAVHEIVDILRIGAFLNFCRVEFPVLIGLMRDSRSIIGELCVSGGLDACKALQPFVADIPDFYWTGPRAGSDAFFEDSIELSRVHFLLSCIDQLCVEHCSIEFAVDELLPRVVTAALTTGNQRVCFFAHSIFGGLCARGFVHNDPTVPLAASRPLVPGLRAALERVVIGEGGGGIFVARVLRRFPDVASFAALNRSIVSLMTHYSRVAKSVDIVWDSVFEPIVSKWRELAPFANGIFPSTASEHGADMDMFELLCRGLPSVDVSADLELLNRVCTAVEECVVRYARPGRVIPAAPGAHSIRLPDALIRVMDEIKECHDTQRKDPLVVWYMRLIADLEERLVQERARGGLAARL